ncbi:MAG: amidohydrolase [Clostridiales Family XIII bacterium]|nr:amidohydrolase [Clostridiales Family XIII bacterium]
MIGYRRELHRIPELDRDLPKTTAYVKTVLAGLPCEVYDIGTPLDSPGFVAFFRGGLAGEDAPSVAFRSDMDALPVQEENEDDYRSLHDGRMHACGHDGHMSILLGFAEIVAEHLATLDKNVLLVFQAAEETTGGARDIVSSGVFEHFQTKKIYGLHLWPKIPKGQVVCRSGAFMASTVVFTVDIEGRQVHVGSFRSGVDALEVGCRFVGAVYEMEKEEIAPHIERLLRIGVFQSGTAVNVVSGAARIAGTLRTFDRGVHDLMWRRMQEIADSLSIRTGATFTLNHTQPYPAVVNPAGLFVEARGQLTDAGLDFQEAEAPLLIAEDFSCYQEALPGLFLHLGTGGEEPLHSCRYQLDEDVLLTGVRVFTTLLGIQ